MGDLLKRLYNDATTPWVYGGDFDLMMWSNEKQGRNNFRYDDAATLRSAVNFCRLED